MKKALATGLAAGWLLLPGAAPGAGWVIEEMDPDFPADRVVYFVGEGRVRVEGFVDGLVFLIDLSEGEGYIVDEERGYYAGGSLSEVVREMSVPPRGSVAEEEEQAGEGVPPAGAMPGLRIGTDPGAEKVAGYEARHYRVYLEDLLVEELWIVPEIPAVAAGRWGSLGTLLDAMTGGRSVGDFGPVYEEQAVYRDLLKTGFVVRQVKYYRSQKSMVEVVKARKRDLPPEIFAVPERMEEAPYRRLFLGQN